MSDTRTLVRLLEADPELASSLTRRERAWAEQLVVAEARTFDPNASYPIDGLWEADSGGEVALFMVDGFAGRKIVFGNSTYVEVLGAGDLICPWTNAEGSVAAREEFIPLTKVRMALLDHAVFTQAARWPSVSANLVRRSCVRSRRLTVQLAATHQVGVERRLLDILWHFAHRWGRVNGAGVRLPLPLSNELLGKIVGSSAPSVSTALGALRRRGAVSRLRNEGWLLAGSPTAE